MKNWGLSCTKWTVCTILGYHFERVSVPAHVRDKYYPGQKNRYSRDIHEIDPQCDHAISCGIDFDQCNASSRCADLEPAGHVDVVLELDFARYHMIELLISLINFSAVTIFLARVVQDPNGGSRVSFCFWPRKENSLEFAFISGRKGDALAVSSFCRANFHAVDQDKTATERAKELILSDLLPCKLKKRRSFRFAT